MSQLWIPIIFMCLLALLFVAVPVLRYREADRRADIEVRKAKNIEVFRQRERELDQDLADGLIDPEQHARLKAELERPFLREMEYFEREQADQERRLVRGRRYNKLVPLVFALLIPAISLPLYLQRGSGQDLVLPGLLERLGEAPTAEAQRDVLAELAIFLEERFERRPEDVRNGYMLANLHMSLENYGKAIEVFDRLLEVVPSGADRATVLGELAQARYLDAGQQITPEVRAVMDQATAINPNQYSVMSLLAIDAFLQDDFSEAVGYWQRQLSQVDPGSNDAQVLRERINQVQQMIPADERPAGEQLAAADGAKVEVRVELGEALRAQVSPDMRVFVFASNPAGGPPLAARDFSASELPLSVTLDDSMAMMPQFRLSSAETVVVGARISKSGTATKQSGDYEAISDPISLQEQEGPVELVISDVVP